MSPAVAHSYTRYRGWVVMGSDLLNGTMSIGRAQELCDAIPDCMSITTALGTGMVTSRKYPMLLKASATWFEDPAHLTLVKQRTPCHGVTYRRMNGGTRLAYEPASSATGPYCCEGACPAEAAYHAREEACDLPAASPLGVPRCLNLRGVPLRNLALSSEGSSAAMSSAWPHAENAGVQAAASRPPSPPLPPSPPPTSSRCAQAAIDGRVAGSYVHTECSGSLAAASAGGWGEERLFTGQAVNRRAAVV